ncbi:MAG: DUF4342 domain-containing protein [Chloroflexota bacterium]|nr:DUF4342 domain-containing protein [Chloroflexota bacterium]
MSQTDPNTSQGRDFTEELTVLGDQLLNRVKELVHEGNVRRVIIKQEGHTIMEIPLTVGVVGVLVAPVLAAIGAIGALMAQCSIEVVRSERPSDTARDQADNARNADTFDNPPAAL